MSRGERVSAVTPSSEYNELWTVVSPPVDDCSFYSLTVLGLFFNCIVPLSGLNSTSSRHHRTQPQAFYATFSLFGNILSCKVATDENGKSKGYGYVHYETGVSANMAIAKIDGMLIAGKQVQ